MSRVLPEDSEERGARDPPVPARVVLGDSPHLLCLEETRQSRRTRRQPHLTAQTVHLHPATHRAVLLMIVGDDVKCQLSVLRVTRHLTQVFLFTAIVIIISAIMASCCCEGVSVRIARRAGRTIYHSRFSCWAADVFNLWTDLS